MKRMSLLTVIIIGDGIIAVAQDVVTIVKTADAWSRSHTYFHTLSLSLSHSLTHTQSWLLFSFVLSI